MTTANSIPLFRRVASVFVHVTDLRRAASWYSELLGLPLREERLNGGPVYWFDLPGTGLLLDNNENNRRQPNWREEMKPLLMFPCCDIDETYDYILTKAQPCFEPERHPGMAYFNFQAPDGRVYMACWTADSGENLTYSPQMSPIRPYISGVFINVRDMKAAAAWISDLLDVPLREEETDESIYVVAADRGADLLLDDNRARHGDSFEIPFMLDTGDIDAAYEFVMERGMNIFHGVERHGSIAFFTVEDPDGNLVMICQGEDERAGDIDGYTLIQLPVQDLQKSVSFYTEVLGFVLEHPERPIEEHVFLRTKSGQGPGLHLCEVEKDEFKPDHWIRDGRPVHGVELHCRDIEALYRRLVRTGVRIEAAPYYVEPCGGYVKFYDPDGHLICVNQSV